MVDQAIGPELLQAKLAALVVAGDLCADPDEILSRSDTWPAPDRGENRASFQLQLPMLLPAFRQSQRRGLARIAD